jgi:hypothetical protein
MMLYSIQSSAGPRKIRPEDGLPASNNEDNSDNNDDNIPIACSDKLILGPAITELSNFSTA